ncbi:hypothetical protein Tco_0867224, partial [Tanacetum coccineum]
MKVNLSRNGESDLEIQKHSSSKHNSENVDTIIESLSYSPIPVKDSDSLMEEIDLFLTSDDSMPPGIESDDYDSEGDFRFLKELLINDSYPLPENESYNLDSFDNPESPVVKSCFDFEPVAAVTNDFDSSEKSGHSREGGHVIRLGGIDIVADDEIQAIAINRPKKFRNRKIVDGASGSGHPPKKLREDHGASGNIGASIGGKSLASIQELFEQSTLNVDVGVTTAATVP